MKNVNLLNAILSHLSDADSWLNYSPEQARKEINIAKAIILYIADEKTDLLKKCLDIALKIAKEI